MEQSGDEDAAQVKVRRGLMDSLRHDLAGAIQLRIRSKGGPRPSAFASTIRRTGRARAGHLLVSAFDCIADPGSIRNSLPCLTLSIIGASRVSAIWIVPA